MIGSMIGGRQTTGLRRRALAVATGAPPGANVTGAGIDPSSPPAAAGTFVDQRRSPGFPPRPSPAAAPTLPPGGTSPEPAARKAREQGRRQRAAARQRPLTAS
jgi:hypothetical protein